MSSYSYYIKEKVEDEYTKVNRRNLRRLSFTDIAMLYASEHTSDRLRLLILKSERLTPL